MRARRLISLCVGAAAALGLTAANACDGLRATDRLTLKPFVLSSAAKIKIADSTCAHGAARFVFATPSGATVARVRLTAAVDHADVAFDFAGDRAKLQFGVEAIARAHRVELFDVNQTVLRPNGAATATTRYPYDWKRAVQRPVREAESVVPGFRAGALNVVYDTPRLGALVVSLAAGEARGLFPFYRERNDKGDLASASHSVRAGEARRMRVYFHNSLAHIQDRRFAAPDRNGLADARIVQFAPRLWAPQPGAIDRPGLARAPGAPHCGAQGRRRTCFPTPDETRAFAAVLPPGNNIVIARIALPLKSAAAAIQAGGGRPFYYLFFGALGFRDADPNVDPGWFLTDSSGKPHMAPRSTTSAGNWTLLDITRPEVRRFFIDRALEALDAGFEGVFLDGGFLWNMPNGKVGGDNPTAAISHNHARHLLMRDLRAAMRARDPGARLGVLANRFQEYMHYADFLVREGGPLHWTLARAAPHLRQVSYDPTNASAKSWRARYGRLTAQPLFHACKGPNPVIVRSCRAALGAVDAAGRAGVGFYYDSGDWDIFDAEIAAGLARATHEPGVYVTRVEGDRKLEGVGVSRLRLLEGAGRVWFSAPTPLLRLDDWRAETEVSHVYRFDAGKAYIPADRGDAAGWRWAREGFLYRGPGTYVAGDFHVIDAPTAPTDGAFRVTIAPSPRLEVARDTPRGPKEAKPDAQMTLRFALPDSARFTLTTPAGDTLDGRPENGRAVVEIEHAGPIQLAIDGLP